MVAISGTSALAYGLNALAAADRVIEVAGNFEHISATALPYMVLGNLLKNTAAPNAAVEMPQALSKVYQDMLDTYLPGEKLLSIESNEVHEPTAIDGGESRATTITLHTTDKDLTSYVNLEEVYQSVRDGKLPTGEQIYLALLDVVDMLDLGVLGDTITTVRLESHIKERTVTITETVSTRVEENPVQDESASVKGNLTGSVTKSYELTTALGGDGLETRNIERIEAQQVLEQRLREEKTSIGQTHEFNQGTETVSSVTTVTHHDSFRIERMDTAGQIQVVASDARSLVLEETHQSRSIGVNQTQHKSELKWWQHLVGAEQKIHTHTFVRQDDKVVVYRRGEDGQMHKVHEDSDSAVLVNEHNTTKGWESGLVSYVPFVGAISDIALKHGHGYSICWDDWLYLGMDAASVVLMVIPGTQGAGLTMMAGKTAAQATGKAVVKAAVKGTAKAALKPKNAIKNFYAHPGKVFSPERIKAKALTKAHNPMKEDILKTMSGLHDIGSSSDIRKFLRKEFVHDKGIAKQLYKNYEYLKKHGYLTPKNLERMQRGKSPMSIAGDGGKLHLDHIVPKSSNPALKADPANLRFMPGTENMARGNRISRRDLKDIKDVLLRYPDEPLPERLHKDITNALKDFPQWANSEEWIQILNRPIVQ